MIYLAECASDMQMCCDLKPFLKAVSIIIDVLKISIPIILIVLGTIDMFKAMATNDEKVEQDAKSTLFKRILYAIVIFIVPYLVNLVLSFTERLLTNSTSEDHDLPTAVQWISCWNQVEAGTLTDYCNNNCENIYEGNNDTGSGTSGGNSGETTQAPKIICYGWKAYSCNNEKIEEENQDANTIGDTPPFGSSEYNGSDCTVTITPARDLGYSSCESLCNERLGGVLKTTRDEYYGNEKCLCQYSPVVIDEYGSSKPNASDTTNHEVDVYECDEYISSCNNVPKSGYCHKMGTETLR